MTHRSASVWGARIDRALDLSTAHPATAAILTFYAALARRQQTLAAADTSIASMDEAYTRGIVAIPDLLHWMAREPSAPETLKAGVEDLLAIGPAEWSHLADSLSRSTDASAAPEMMAFTLEASVQPFAERVAARPGTGGLEPARQRCPICGGLPTVGVLREEGHGSKRTLLCGLCLTEWSYLRVTCPRCRERTFDRLPVFGSDDVPGARIDACEACRHYLKTIDLTADGLAVPLVDDLATLPLDLWAREQGYTRTRPNLLRL